MKWLQTPDETKLLQIHNIGIEAAIKFKATAWLSDNSIGFLLDLSMQRALAELSINRLPQTRLEKFARVVPMDVFQELVLHRINNLIGEKSCYKIDVEMFSNVQDAESWLARKSETIASAC